LRLRRTNDETLPEIAGWGSDAGSMVDEWTRDLYARCGAMVLRRARSLLGDEEAAWDALQEVFVRALRSGRAFRQESSPTTWLYRITTNYCFNVLRDAGRRQEKLRGLPPALPDRGDPSPPDVRLALSQILARLPDELCEIAVYHHVDRMSHDEIAAVMGVSRRTIGNRLKDFQRQAQAALGRSIELVA
jgi:RNA polymerase sigma-70 factor (ECF subfamily)